MHATAGGLVNPYLHNKGNATLQVEVSENKKVMFF